MFNFGSKYIISYIGEVPLHGWAILRPGISDFHMNRLAKCTSNSKRETNLRRNLHSLLAKTGRQLQVPISFAACLVRVVNGGKVKKQVANWPVLHFSDWIKASLVRGGELLLGGNHVLNISSWQTLFQNFWREYQLTDPTHPLFEIDSSLWKLYLPFTHHGDEGRGRNKDPVLIESFVPMISFKGINYTNLSGPPDLISKHLHFLWHPLFSLQTRYCRYINLVVCIQPMI